MSSSLSSWNGTDEHFVNAFDEYRERSREASHLMNALHTHLPPAMENIHESVYSHHGINILSVGSGDGHMDIEILKTIYNELKRKLPSLSPIKMFNRVIEPAEENLRLYKTKTENLPQELSQAEIVFDIDEPKTFDDYTAKTKDDVTFHIVHFIHSLYFVDDVEKALKHCYDHELANKGVIMLVLCEEDALQRQTMRLAKGLPSEEGHTGHEIARVARSYGWRHEVHTFQFAIDVTDVFDEHSSDGNLLLDFLAYTMNFRAISKAVTVDSVLEAIKNSSTSSDGKIFAKGLNRIHLIFKK